MRNRKELYEVVYDLPSNIRIFEQVVAAKSSVRRIHWHEHMEIHFILEGQGTVICGEHLLNVKKDDFIIINSCELHHGVADHYCRYLCMMFPPSFFEDKYIFRNHFSDEYVKELVYKIYDEYKSDGKEKKITIKGYSYLLFAHLIKNYSTVHLSEARYRQHVEKMERINDIKKYISENYKQNLSTAFLAELFHMSEGYLCHCFKDTTGKTIKEYINFVRIEKASDLIIAGDMSIMEAAFECGFHDANYFSRCYKKMKGTTPTSLRK